MQMALDFQTRIKIHSLGGQGILNAKDIKELSAACQRVLELMSDGQWYGAEEIRLAAGSDGVPASEGLRRMRELKALFNIERRRAGDGRNFEYRINGSSGK